MSFEADDSGRIGQPGYWMWFGISMIGTVLLIVGGAMQMFRGHWGTGILCILAVLPLSIYFRVIEMRRCRDIGWPASLPWIMLGLQFLCGFLVRPSAGAMAGGMPAAGAGLGMFAASGLLGLADFVLMIVLGCIATKAYDWAVFGDDFDPADLPQAPRGYLDGAAIDPQAMARPMPRGIDEALDGAMPGPTQMAAPRAANVGQAMQGGQAMQAGHAIQGGQAWQGAPGLRAAGGFGRKGI